MDASVIERPVTRPLMRYPGGKWRLAPWILTFFPPHRVYTEVYGGGASVLLRKPRSKTEVYNDLAGEIVNVFRVLRDPVQAAALVRLVELTPYAREEFELSFEPCEDPVEQARRTLFRSAAGHGISGASGQWRTGFCVNVGEAGTHRATNWADYPPIIRAVVERLRGVVIENAPAVEVLQKHDGLDAVHYVDPPYLMETRGRWQSKMYRHEMTEQDHLELAQVLRGLKGYVVLSGYDSPLYADLYGDWQKHTRPARADQGLPRTEVLWIKSAAYVQTSMLDSV